MVPHVYTVVMSITAEDLAARFDPIYHEDMIDHIGANPYPSYEYLEKHLPYEMKGLYTLDVHKQCKGAYKTIYNSTTLRIFGEGILDVYGPKVFGVAYHALRYMSPLERATCAPYYCRSLELEWGTLMGDLSARSNCPLHRVVTTHLRRNKNMNGFTHYWVQLHE